jgi:hypothetical protein
MFIAILFSISATCEVFYQMFEYRMKESSEGRIQVDDVASGTMSAFLEYLYTKECNYFNSKDVNDLIALYVLADRYLVEDLKSRCLEVLISTLTVEENALENWDFLWDFAQSYGFTNITQAMEIFCWT